MPAVAAKTLRVAVIEAPDSQYHEWEHEICPVPAVDLTVDFKWQSVVRRTDVTKCRLAGVFLSVFGNDIGDNVELTMIDSEWLLFLA